MFAQEPFGQHLLAEIGQFLLLFGAQIDAGQHHYRDFHQVGVTAHLFQDAEAIHIRHEHIQHHHVRALLLDHLPADQATVGKLSLEPPAVVDQLLQQPQIVEIVVDH